MKKSLKFYIIVWALFLAIYNLTVFLVKPIIPGYVIIYDLRFWISWGVTIAAFVGQLICAVIAFSSKNSGKFFLNIPLVAQSYTASTVITVAGIVLMLIPNCPAWIAAIVCAAVSAFSIISVIKATAATAVVSGIDDKIKAETFFIRSLSVDAECLISRAKSETTEAECKKVYEAVRYSDPMSNDALSLVEEQIGSAFAKFSNAVAEESDDIAGHADEVVRLVEERNKKCKLLK